jgi:hypothetical protein
MQFEKEHLVGETYNWLEINDKCRQPDRRIFDRSNGNQLLNMINSFGESIGALSIDDGLRIEKLILDELPLEVKSEIGVFNWLKGKYLYTWN